MKWIFLMLSFFSCDRLFSQQWAGSSNTSGLAFRDGNILIGSTSSVIQIGATDRAIELVGTNSLIDMRLPAGQDQFSFSFSPSFGEADIASNILPLGFLVGGHAAMHMLLNGKVLIGKSTQTNAGYMLDVNGNIRANKVVVNTTGADFVFDSAYRLPSLTQVNKYIRAVHHLPGIAAARQMQEQGADVGDVQTQLLQKIEELTLYAIRQEREISELKEKELSELKEKDRQNKGLEARITALENQLSPHR